MCLLVDCCLSELALYKSNQLCCLVQADIIISLKYNLFSPWYNRNIAEVVLSNNHSLILFRSCRGRDHMVAGFTTTYAMSGYHHKIYEFESCWWWGVLDTTLCDKVCQWLAAGWWFSADTKVSSSNTTNCHDKKHEMSLKVALNITHPVNR
jgi:hypothetical protein